MDQQPNTEKLKRFDRLFNRYYTCLKVFVHNYVNDSGETEDIVQSAFIRLWEHGRMFEADPAVRSFLFSVCRNLALDHLKHRKVQREFYNRSIDSIRLAEAELAEAALREFKDFSTENEGMKDKVHLAVMKLPFSDRKIFMLSRYNNLTNAEIADLLGISVKTVEKRLKLSIGFIRKKFTFIFM